MKSPLRRALDRIGPWFEEGRPLSWLEPLSEAVDTALYSPGRVTSTAPHVRDGLDVNRMMGIVVIALVPCVLMALYNTELSKAQSAIASGAAPLDDWRTAIYLGAGLEFDTSNPLLCAVHGALYFIPVLVVAFVTGLTTWHLTSAPSDGLHEFRGHTMGTTFLVKIDADMSAADRDRAREVIESRLDLVSRLMSTYDSTSELSRFNRYTGVEPVPASDDLIQVLTTALDVSEVWGPGPHGSPPVVQTSPVCSALLSAAATSRPTTVSSSDTNVAPEEYRSWLYR